MHNREFSSHTDRSTFVSTLSWVFMVIFGFITLIAILQNVMLAVFFPAEQIQASLSPGNGGDQLPAFVQFSMGKIRYIFAAFLGVSSAMFVSSIALLKRKNWARIVFITFFVFAIVSNIGGFIFQFMSSSLFPMIPPDAPADFADQFEQMRMIMLGVSSIITICLIGVCGWLIKRLISPGIRAEFCVNVK